MFKFRKKQKGGVLIEAAITLPLILTAVFLVVEAVNYGADRLYLNSRLTDLTEVLNHQINSASTRNPVADAPFVCDDVEGSTFQRVRFTGDPESHVQGQVFEVLEKVYKDLKRDSLKVEMIDGKPTDLTQTYVFKVSFPYQGVLVPQLDVLPVYAHLLVTVDMSCI